MLIECRYERTIYRDEGTGYTIFSARTEQGNIPVDIYGCIIGKGYMPYCIKSMPLLLDCDPENSDENCLNYLINSVSFGTSSQKAVEEFLSSSEFAGIGEVKAKRIAQKYKGFDQLARSKDLLNTLKTAGLTPATAEKTAKKIQQFADTADMVQLVLKYGGSVACITTAYKIFGEEARKTIEENPYMLMITGMSFQACDYIAREKGISQYDKRRLTALVKAGISLAMAGGSTKTEFKTLCRACMNIEKKCGLTEYTSPFYLAGCLNNLYVLKKEDGTFYIYNRKTYELEEDTARNIIRLQTDEEADVIDDKEIAKIEADAGIVYSDAQKEALHLIETPGIKILTGGPGTGKTTVIHGILKLYEKKKKGDPVILCAPTGCAAKRLSETTGRHASTIHRLLGARPVGGRFMQAKNEICKLPKGLIIVDESSMLDEQLFHMLVVAVAGGSVLLLSGDEDQLPPVGGGNILHDLLGIQDIQKCRLNKVYRQKSDSGILENSARIREGREDLEETDDYKIIRCDSPEALKDAAMVQMNIWYQPDEPDKTKIYTPVRKKGYDAGTMELNRAFHEYYTQDREADSIVYCGREFQKGDPVIFLANNYEKGYFNGDTGIVTAILNNGGSGKTMLVSSDGQEYEITGAQLGEVDLAYAITAHKSQGSECETAIVVVPQKPANMLSRSLVYVATTRARVRNIVLTEQDALEKAIRNTRQNIRHTGLQARILELAQGRKIRDGKNRNIGHIENRKQKTRRDARPIH